MYTYPGLGLLKLSIAKLKTFKGLNKFSFTARAMKKAVKALKSTEQSVKTKTALKKPKPRKKNAKQIKSDLCCAT